MDPQPPSWKSTRMNTLRRRRVCPSREGTTYHRVAFPHSPRMDTISTPCLSLEWCIGRLCRMPLEKSSFRVDLPSRIMSWRMAPLKKKSTISMRRTGIHLACHAQDFRPWSPLRPRREMSYSVKKWTIRTFRRRSFCSNRPCIMVRVSLRKSIQSLEAMQIRVKLASTSHQWILKLEALISQTSMSNKNSKWLSWEKT